MTDSGGKILLEALEQQSHKYRKRLRICRRNCNETAVHNVRTAARKLLSLLELLRAIRPEVRVNKLRQRIKDQLDAFDELRDTQVMLLEVENNLSQLPTLAAFHQYLQQREQQLLVLAHAYIKHQSAANLHLKLRKARHRCQRLIKTSDIPAEITRVINDLNINISDRQHAVDVDDLDSIHHLRIAVKKLRYTLIASQRLLPEYPPAQLQALLDYLTLMGDIQNSAVLSHTLQQYYSQDVPADIQQHFQQRQQALLEGFKHLQTATQLSRDTTRGLEQSPFPPGEG